MKTGTISQQSSLPNLATEKKQAQANGTKLKLLLTIKVLLAAGSGSSKGQQKVSEKSVVFPVDSRHTVKGLQELVHQEAQGKGGKLRGVMKQLINKNGSKDLKCTEILYEGEYQLLESCIIGDCLVDFSKITAVFCTTDTLDCERHPSTSNSSDEKYLSQDLAQIRKDIVVQAHQNSLQNQYKFSKNQRKKLKRRAANLMLSQDANGVSEKQDLTDNKKNLISGQQNQEKLLKEPQAKKQKIVHHMMNFSSEESSQEKVTIQVPPLIKEEKEAPKEALKQPDVIMEEKQTSPKIQADQKNSSSPIEDLKEIFIEKLKDASPLTIDQQVSQSTKRKIDLDKAVKFYRQQKEKSLSNKSASDIQMTQKVVLSSSSSINGQVSGKQLEIQRDSLDTNKQISKNSIQVEKDGSQNNKAPRSASAKSSSSSSSSSASASEKVQKEIPKPQSDNKIPFSQNQEMPKTMQGQGEQSDHHKVKIVVTPVKITPAKKTVKHPPKNLQRSLSSSSSSSMLHSGFYLPVDSSNQKRKQNTGGNSEFLKLLNIDAQMNHQQLQRKSSQVFGNREDINLNEEIFQDDEESSEEMEIRIRKEKQAALAQKLNIEKSSDGEDSSVRDGDQKDIDDLKLERKDSLKEAQYLKGNLF